MTPTSPPTVQFLGAVQTVTGSMHLVETAGQKILLDCGLYLGRQSGQRRRNRLFPFAANEIDAILLTHAHIDHCGNLPNLIRQGYRGPIYCTPATRDLLGVMLADSARIQEKEAAAGVAPLYNQSAVAATIDQCVDTPYGKRCTIGDVEFVFADAGHVLGSATVHMRMAVPGHERTLTYTGDLGRQGIPFLQPPAPLPPADLLICESTYGGRFHPPRTQIIEQLAQVIAGAIDRNGRVLIPAFSLGRTQIVVHFLHKWIREGALPRIPIFVDSPLVQDIMEVYRRHPECLDGGSRSLLDNAGDTEKSLVRYLHSANEIRSLRDWNEPCIIVASGGMLDGGRAVYHLQQYVDDPRCSIVLVSFQAPHSLGWRLLEKGPTVSFLGRTWNKWASVIQLRGFSGHADHEDFRTALAPLVGCIGQTYLVHGEPEPASALLQEMKRMGFARVFIPRPDQVVAIGENSH